MNRSSSAVFACLCLALILLAEGTGHAEFPANLKPLFEKHCFGCHDTETKKGDLDLTALNADFADADSFARWVKVHDRIQSGEMPPKKKPRPDAGEIKAVTGWLAESLINAERPRIDAERYTGVRRLTRAEYENTVRDLFDMPGIAVQDGLPADGTVHGFDKNSDALSMSHVNLATYMDTADRVLDFAIGTQPTPPVAKLQRISLANEQSTLGGTVLDGDAVMLKNKQPDPNYPPAGIHKHISYPTHLGLRMHSDVSPGASVGVFRHEDESFKPSFAEFIAIYPARYRIRTAFWSFIWDKGKVLPSDKTLTARLDMWHISGDGRGTGHPSTLLGYFDAPPGNGQSYEFDRWLNPGDSFGFNFCNSTIGHQIRTSKDRLAGFTGPGLACDGLEVEGPIYDQWPPASHRVLFGDLPLVEFKAAEHPGVRAPKHPPLIQKFNARNRPDPAPQTLKLFAVHSGQPLADADRLLANFLPKAFRRPVAAEIRQGYVARVDAALKAGDCFETAMRKAYRAALCAPDFLYHLEFDSPRTAKTPASPQRPFLDDFSLASRLSYFFWNSMPDATLTELATSNTLHEPEVLKAQVTRLLKDAKSARFREDFLGQWLKLRQITATDPDGRLYSWRPDLGDAMVAETRGYFQELLDQDLGASYLIKSDFAMLNQRIADFYGIPGVIGTKVRRVPVPAGSPRGPFITQGSILKITANGTTTSPVPRGAFVMDRLLGQPPEPPPATVAAVEPDVRGATTIREQLAKHRDDATCAACHAKIDPPGFALESFDVIGAWRERYGTITNVRPPVDPTGVLPDGRTFANIAEYQTMVAADTDRLLKNMAEHFAVYGIGRGLNFSDRASIAAVVEYTQKHGGGIRTLLHELVQSSLFQTR